MFVFNPCVRLYNQSAMRRGFLGLVREGWNKIIQLQVCVKRGDSSTFTPSYLITTKLKLGTSWKDGNDIAA